MNKILKDPLAPKQKKNGEYPFEFKAPTYDNRSSCGISAGNDYGEGHKNPHGLERASHIDQGPIPQQAHCFSVDEIFDKFKGEDKRG